MYFARESQAKGVTRLGLERARGEAALTLTVLLVPGPGLSPLEAFVHPIRAPSCKADAITANCISKKARPEGIR